MLFGLCALSVSFMTGKKQIIFKFIFQTSLWPNGFIFSRFLNCSGELLFCGVQKYFHFGPSNFLLSNFLRFTPNQRFLAIFFLYQPQKLPKIADWGKKRWTLLNQKNLLEPKRKYFQTPQDKSYSEQLRNLEKIKHFGHIEVSKILF